MEKQLASLLALLPQAEVIGSADKVITDVTADSRAVVAGSLFICLKGATVDGHKFLAMAAEKGAVAALVEDVPAAVPQGVTLIKVADTREAMELVTPYFYDYPGRKLRMIGVTGTNGKTTSTNIIRLILRKAGYKVGLIGTINIMINDEITESHNTTPDVVDLQKTLYAMCCAGCDYCVMEVSSHALALKRVAGIEYDCAVLTNITQDHLDFHKTMENYRDAKSLLFEHLTDGSKPNKNAVFNMDDASSAIIRERTKANVLTYGEGHDNDIYPLSFTVEPKHMQLLLHTPVGEMDLELKITGEFNVYNVMGVIGAMLAEKIDKDIICSVLDGFDGVPGRFQLVMGALALELADNIVVTSDNPRTEDPELIIDEIFTALQNVPEGKHVTRLSDRREAICYALAEAAADDVILIAGKGHENYQILKDRTIHFDDKEVVMEYWSDKKC